MSRFSRFVLPVLILVVLLISACQPQVVTEEVVVTQEVEVEVPVEVPVEVEVEVPLPEVRIGVVYPLTGPIGAFGGEIRFAVQLATEIINGEYPELGDFPFAQTKGLPNLGGARWVPVFADHQGKPELGTIEMERLITEEDIAATVGSYNSSVTIATRVVTERFGIPMVNDASSSARLNTQRVEEGLEWYFSNTPDDGDNARLFFDLIDDLNEQQDAGIETVALIHDNVELGMAGAEVNIELAAERGYEIVENIAYEPGTVELTGEVIRLKLSEPDVVLFHHSGPAECEAYYRAAQEMDFNPRVFHGGIGCSFVGFQENLGAASDYTAARESFSLDLAKATGRDEIIKINELYKQGSGGHDLNANTARNFMGQIILATIINNAGSTDPEAIRQAAIELDMPAEDLITPWFGVKYDPETGKNIHAVSVVVQTQDGEWRLVYPFEIAAVDFIWPFVNWDDR